MERRLFGTDGVRGIANVEPMTSETALRLGRALAHVNKRSPRRHKILIGKDTRLSGYMLETAMASGICSMGVDVLLVGPLPTPGIAFLTRTLRADAGVVISASHNPFQDNGIKFFSQAGFKLPDEVEGEIERLVLGDTIDALRPTATEIGKAFRIDDAVGRYNVFVKSTFPRALTLDGMTLAIDCGHGAGYRVGPEVLEELGARVVPLGVEPDGENINEACGALHPEALQSAVRACGAQIGVALDELRRETLVATVMSNLGLHVAMRERGIQVITTPVGDRHVVEEMVRGGYSFGGEQSGHLVFLGHATTGDGTLAALQVLAVMCRQGRPMSELKGMFEPVPQTLLNVEIKRRRDLGDLPEVLRAIAAVESKLKREGRVLVRLSGTEAKARVLIEGPDAKKNRAFAEEIGAALKRALA
jgi:phosphoglucosamine mutase